MTRSSQRATGRDPALALASHLLPRPLQPNLKCISRLGLGPLHFPESADPLLGSCSRANDTHPPQSARQLRRSGKHAVHALNHIISAFPDGASNCPLRSGASNTRDDSMKPRFEFHPTAMIENFRSSSLAPTPKRTRPTTEMLPLELADASQLRRVGKTIRASMRAPPVYRNSLCTSFLL
jgi:hypothetical protein